METAIGAGCSKGISVFSINSLFLKGAVEMLVRRYYVSDIRKYEEENGKSIIDLFNRLSFDGLIDLIVLGNANCTVEMACEMLDNYLQDNKIEDAYKEIRDCLLGVGEIEGTIENGIDVTQYNNITDIYQKFCMDLMSMGLNYSEFWSLTTVEMYKLFKSIILKVVNEINRQLYVNHIQAGEIGAAFAGKLEKEAPRISYGEEAEAKEVYVEGVGEVDQQTLSNIIELETLKDKFGRKG